MTTQTEALKLSFEKMTGVPDAWTNPALMQVRNGFISGWEAALAQPEQEPVVEIEFLDWVHPKLGVTKVEVEGGKPLILKAKIKFPTSDKCPNCASLEDELERTRIKATVWKSAYDVEVGYKEKDTTPPQRKPLTNEEIMNIAKVSCIGISPHEDTLNFAKVIEAVHGIRSKT